MARQGPNFHQLLPAPSESRLKREIEKKRDTTNSCQKADRVLRQARYVSINVSIYPSSYLSIYLFLSLARKNTSHRLSLQKQVIYVAPRFTSKEGCKLFLRSPTYSFVEAGWQLVIPWQALLREPLQSRLDCKERLCREVMQPVAGQRQRGDLRLVQREHAPDACTKLLQNATLLSECVECSDQKCTHIPLSLWAPQKKRKKILCFEWSPPLHTKRQNYLTWFLAFICAYFMES